jgi:cytosine deaminase
MNHSAYSDLDLNLYRMWLDSAIEQAEKSWSEGGIPIGSVLVDPASQNGRGEIVARGHNERVQSSKLAGDPSKGDPTAHAEVMCMRNAGRRRDWNRLTLVSTLSPCPMCSGTSILFKIPRVIVGENRTFMGAEEWMKREGIEVIVLDDPRCIELMERMKREKPDLWAEDIGE